MTKSAGSKTWPVTKSSTAQSIFGRSGSIKSKMNFEDPSLPFVHNANGWIIALGNGFDPNLAFKRGIGVIQY
jgi:hypothetical protein